MDVKFNVKTAYRIIVFVKSEMNEMLCREVEIILLIYIKMFLHHCFIIAFSKN